MGAASVTVKAGGFPRHCVASFCFKSMRPEAIAPAVEEHWFRKPNKNIALFVWK